MSSRTSARGLSFALIRRSMTSTTCAVARTVIVLAVLFAWIIGCTGICGIRMTVLTVCASSVASAWLMKKTLMTRSSYCWCFCG